MDEKTQKLVDREIKKALKDERKRITDGLKEYKESLVDDDAIDSKQRKAINATISAASKIVRDAA